MPVTLLTSAPCLPLPPYRSVASGGLLLGLYAQSTHRRSYASAAGGGLRMGISASSTHRRSYASAAGGGLRMGISASSIHRRSYTSAAGGGLRMGISASSTSRRSFVSTSQGGLVLGASAASVYTPTPTTPSITGVSNWGQFRAVPYTVNYTQASGTTLVVVAIGYLASAAPVIPPAGWTLATSATSGSDFLGRQWNTDIFYLNNVTAGTYSWTFNFTVGTPSLGNIIIITGANATSPIDQTATSGGASSSASCGPTGTTAASNELVLCSIWNGVTNTNGYALETQSTASGLPYLQTYGLTVSSAGTQTCDFTTGGAYYEYSAGLLTIKG